MLVSPPGEPGTDPTAFYEGLAATPGVRGISLFAGVPLVPEAGTPSARLTAALNGIGVVAPIDPTADLVIGRPRLVAGRLPDPSRAGEVLVSQRLAQFGDVHVGDHIDAVVASAPPDRDEGEVVEATRGDPIRLTVTGIGVLNDEVVPFGNINEWGSLLTTPALAARVDRAEWNFEGALVDVIPGTDLDALTAVIESLGRLEDLGGRDTVDVARRCSHHHHGCRESPRRCTRSGGHPNTRGRRVTRRVVPVCRAVVPPLIVGGCHPHWRAVGTIVRAPRGV